MSRHWIVSLMLFLSLAANILLVSMWIGKTAGQSRQPVKMVMERLDTLPVNERVKAVGIVKNKRIILVSHIMELRKARRDAFRFIASDAYNRAEAERKLANVREKTTILQETAQGVMLDIADTLPPEQRRELLKSRWGR